MEGKSVIVGELAGLGMEGCGEIERMKNLIAGVALGILGLFLKGIGERKSDGETRTEKRKRVDGD